MLFFLIHSTKVTIEGKCGGLQFFFRRLEALPTASLTRAGHGIEDMDNYNFN
jgi:hypothetical protein